mmetsp:Transcript_62683/g.149584  ORF Transcript_62683/g.149584 Transcript_62683/m.149584 type:complete len:205 (+) Transcript_62683:618-1232(+)
MQRSTRHVLGDEAKVWQLQAGTNESHQALVAEMPEGVDLSRQVLHHEFCHILVEEQLLDGHLLSPVVASKDLSEFALAQALDELEIPVLDLLWICKIPFQHLPRSGQSALCRNRGRHLRSHRDVCPWLAMLIWSHIFDLLGLCAGLPGPSHWTAASRWLLAGWPRRAYGTTAWCCNLHGLERAPVLEGRQLPGILPRHLTRLRR